MPSTTAIHPKGPRKVLPVQGALAWTEAFLLSTIGQKLIVALTGLSLAVFLIGHMIGNAKMFSGPESINKYAYFLKHDLGLLIWIARGGLLAAFLLHITLTLRLKLRSAIARPVPYAMQVSSQATLASKTMLLTGLVIGAFTVFHLAHYTFGWVHSVDSPDGKGVKNYLDLEYQLRNGQTVHNVYAMVISGFSTWWISIIYVFTQLLLFVHLSHGIPSALTTLGLIGRRFARTARLLGYAVAGGIVLGNLMIVAAVWTGYLK